MNSIILRGKISEIEPSHKIGDIEYNKAILHCKREDGKEDEIYLRFKKIATPEEDKEVELIGNIRSFSRKLDNGKNSVKIYVSTYFDKPSELVGSGNECEIDGHICKISNVEYSKSGVPNIHFILANNIEKHDSKKLNSYIPCIAWGDLSLKLLELKIGDKIAVKGKLHSRQYKKRIDDSNYEIRTAHEVVIADYTKIS